MKNRRKLFSTRCWWTQASQVMLGLDFSSTCTQVCPDL